MNAIPEESKRLDFWDLTKVIFRRWKISLPLLLLSIAGTAAVAVTAKPDYTETAYIQLVPLSTGVQNNATTSALTNPLAVNGMNSLGQAIIYATQDQGFQDSLKAAGHTTSFTLTLTYPDPIVTIEVVGKTAADTVTTTQLVVQHFQDNARAMQKKFGVKDQDMVATERLDQSDNVKPSGGKVKRAIIAVAAVGLLLTGGITVLVDALGKRRARRQREQEGKINPLAIELALARAESVPGPTNGGAADLLPKIPAARIEPVVPKQSEPVAEPVAGPAVADSGAAPSFDPAATQVVRPAANKPARVLKAGTYRSIPTVN